MKKPVEHAACLSLIHISASCAFFIPIEQMPVELLHIAVKCCDTVFLAEADPKGYTCLLYTSIPAVVMPVRVGAD